MNYANNTVDLIMLPSSRIIFKNRLVRVGVSVKTPDVKKDRIDDYLMIIESFIIDESLK